MASKHASKVVSAEEAVPELIEDPVLVKSEQEAKADAKADAKSNDTPTSVEELAGVGPATAKKLAENGYATIMALATASVAEIANIGSIGEKTAQKIIESARGALNLSFETADIVNTRRKAMSRVTTGSNELNKLLGGGMETGSMTELYGEFRSGKTQLAHQLCVCAQLPIEKGGLYDGKNPVTVAYIDTEGTFRPERIIAMAQRFELDPEATLKNIQVGRAYNSDHQMCLADKVLQTAQEKNIRVLIVDSLVSHFRAEFMGRGTLANRQQKLNQHLHALLRAAEMNNMLVIVTNQVQAKPDVFFGDPNQASGGNIVAHASQTRLKLRKSKGPLRVVQVVDSPLLPESECVFSITEAGIADE